KPGAGSPAGVRAWLQAKAAVSMVSNSRKAVLPTVPLMVIAPASRDTTVPLPRSRKVESDRTGLPLRIGFPPGVGVRMPGRRIHGPVARAGKRVVRKAGLEPARLAAPAPKAGASTSSATFAVLHPIMEQKNARRGRALR